MKTEFQTKQQAITFARQVRSNGGTAKVFEKSQVYTKPFVGLDVAVSYFVEH